MKRDIVTYIFIVFLATIFISQILYINKIEVPINDGAAYLRNAKDWLSLEKVTEVTRPPMISWLIAGTWTIIGEKWEIVKYFQATFTIFAILLLYFILKKDNDPIFAALVAGLTALNTNLIFWSSHILTEGISFFFLILTLYFSRKEGYLFSTITGICVALTFASRYPVIVQAIAIALAQFLIRIYTQKDAASMKKVINETIVMGIAAVFFVLLVISLIEQNTGVDFRPALERDTKLTIFLSKFYIENYLEIFGIIAILAPLAFFFKELYKDKKNLAYVSWAICALLFWSANSINQQGRFTFHFVPAIYYLTIFAFYKIINILDEKTYNLISGKQTQTMHDKYKKYMEPVR